MTHDPYTDLLDERLDTIDDFNHFLRVIGAQLTDAQLHALILRLLGHTPEAIARVIERNDGGEGVVRERVRQLLKESLTVIYAHYGAGEPPPLCEAFAGVDKSRGKANV